MLIILDRDGVINYDSTEYIKSPAEWIEIPNSLSAIAKLNALGHQVVVATNQSGIGRGYYSLKMLETIHQKMRSHLAIAGGFLDGIYFCPHTPSDHCNCRKPASGLLLEIARDFKVDLQQDAVLVGDSLRDIQAAQGVNCPTVLVKTGNGEKTWLNHSEQLLEIPIYQDLADFVNNYFKEK